MNTFPKEIIIKNNEDIYNDDEFLKLFTKLNYERIIKELRNDIYNFIISRKDENDYFDIELFGNKHNYKKAKLENMMYFIRSELEELGWKTKLSFGDTGLFIFSTKDDPSSCW